MGEFPAQLVPSGAGRKGDVKRIRAMLWPLSPPATVLLPVARLYIGFVRKNPPGIAGIVEMICIEEIEDPLKIQSVIAPHPVGEHHEFRFIHRLYRV